jgi:hypothetical protein
MESDLMRVGILFMNRGRAQKLLYVADHFLL